MNFKMLASSLSLLLGLTVSLNLPPTPIAYNLPPSSSGFYPTTYFTITDFGAVADNSTMNTDALNAAIAAASAAPGGGIVIVPAGGAFLTGGIDLKSNVYLFLEDGAFI